MVLDQLSAGFGTANSFQPRTVLHDLHATVFYRDVRHFTKILLALLFWLTPIIYDIKAVSPSLRTVLYMNPFSYFILAYQDALYHNIFSSLDRLMALTTTYSAVTGFRLHTIRGMQSSIL